jgi:chromosome segregation ATPase
VSSHSTHLLTHSLTVHNASLLHCCRVQIASLQADLDIDTRKFAEAKKAIQTVERERDVEQEKRRREAERLREEHEKVEDGERSVKHLENRINRYREEAVKTRNVIYHLEKDREKFGVQLAEAQTRLAHAEEECKLKESQLQEAEKKEAELRGRLKQQQSMYEAVRADRNTYSKNLIEAQDEIAEMKRKFKIMNHQVRRRVASRRRTVSLSCHTCVLRVARWEIGPPPRVTHITSVACACACVFLTVLCRSLSTFVALRRVAVVRSSN